MSGNAEDMVGDWKSTVNGFCALTVTSVNCWQWATVSYFITAVI